MITFGSDIVNKHGIKVSKGSVVVAEGDKGRDMFVVHQGELEVIRKINEQERVVRTIKAGEFFGELSLLNNEPRLATVRASKASVLIKISPQSFETFVKKLPDLALKVIIVLATRLRQTNQEVISLQESDEDMKLLKSLLTKVDTLGTPTVKGIKVDTSLEAVGEEINSSKEVVLRVKEDLKNAENLISFSEGKGIEILNLELMNEFVDFIQVRNEMLKAQNLS